MRRIYALAGASFAMGTEAYVYAGHLGGLAGDLGSSVGATRPPPCQSPERSSLWPTRQEPGG